MLQKKIKVLTLKLEKIIEWTYMLKKLAKETIAELYFFRYA